MLTLHGNECCEADWVRAPFISCIAFGKSGAYSSTLSQGDSPRTSVCTGVGAAIIGAHDHWCSTSYDIHLIQTDRI